MKYRRATLLATEDESTAQTKTIDLDLTEIISRIRICIRATNNSNTIAGHPALIAKNISIVDGSDVLFSLSGQEVQATEYYGTKKYPMEVISYMTGDIIQPGLNIFFGRHLFDKQYAFDPKKFTNPQLKISTDKNLGGSGCNALSLAVYADLFDEKAVSPSGFLSTKEIFNFLPAASGHKFIDLPTDLLYRMLMIQAYSKGHFISDQLYNIKLSENMDKKVVMDHCILDVIKVLLAEYDPLTEDILAYVANTGTDIPCQAGYEGVPVGMQYGATGYANSSGGLAGGKFTAYSATSAYVKYLTRGWCPHSVVQIMPGDIDDPDDWYDPSALKSLRLDLTAGAGATITDALNIIVQQLRKY